MSRPGIEDAYRLAWRALPALPPTIGYGLFRAGADVAWLAGTVRRQHRGVGQLRRNLARLHPELTDRNLDRLTRDAMRSYMRYFDEAFSLPAVTPSQLRARVRAILPDSLHADLARGSIVIALPHMGNWDLVGAWASTELAPVLTVAERLRPEDLFEQFVAFRRSLGMHVIGQGRGERVFDRLVHEAGSGTYVLALLADRDLSSAGVEVDLAGHRAHVAAGPAALADRLGLPLYAATVHYERLSGARRRAAGSTWGVVLTVHAVPGPSVLDGADHHRERVAAWTQAWVSALEPGLVEHAEDWHMLQAVFDADLDPARLAASRARQAARLATVDQAGNQPTARVSQQHVRFQPSQDGESCCRTQASGGVGTSEHATMADAHRTCSDHGPGGTDGAACTCCDDGVAGGEEGQQS